MTPDRERALIDRAIVAVLIIATLYFALQLCRPALAAFTGS